MSFQVPVSAHDDLIGGTSFRRIALNFFTHSGHVPIALLILEAIFTGRGYFLEPDPYVLLLSGFMQAAFLGRAEHAGRPRPMLGNLVGPSFYSLVEFMLEGFSFFGQWHHLAYWAFGFAFALVQGIQGRIPRIVPFLAILENVLRAAIPLSMYAVFETRDMAPGTRLAAFFEDDAHVYLSIVLLLLGLLIGFADLGLRRSQATVRDLLARLREYSSWSLGKHILSQAIHNESVLQLQRVERAILFMDIRGFTQWSERQAPEVVVNMLNQYYRLAESSLAVFQPIKTKFSADEVMAVFRQPAQAVAAAQALHDAMPACLEGVGLGMGIGIHAGPVVEGVIGGGDSKAYDFIGDTVNTASRLCSAAAAGEVLASEAVCRSLGKSPAAWREISVKGKQQVLRVAALNCLDA